MKKNISRALASAWHRRHVYTRCWPASQKRQKEESLSSSEFRRRRHRHRISCVAAVAALAVMVAGAGAGAEQRECVACCESYVKNVCLELLK